jgi:hypothetical protein
MGPVARTLAVAEGRDLFEAGLNEAASSLAATYGRSMQVQLSGLHCRASARGLRR